MKTIQITRRNGSMFDVLVDDRDYAQVVNLKWHITTPTTARATPYCSRKTSNGVKQIVVQMHNQILGFNRYLPENEGLVVDHINGNGLDNQRANLRIVTISENIRNQHRRIPSASGVPGIYPYRKANVLLYWVTTILLPNGKRQHVGLSKTLEDAIKLQERAYRGEVEFKSRKSKNTK